MLRACVVCGALSPQSRCPAHAIDRKRGNQWRRIRAQALKRYGNQCAATYEGHRCPITRGLEVHHIIPLANGGTNHQDNLVPLCTTHHRLADQKARAA